MSRDFLSNFERTTKPVKGTAEANDSVSVINGESDFKNGDYPRCVCFVWPDGKRIFMDYSRLHPGEINAEHDTIVLNFDSEIVEIKGIILLPLFLQFMEHQKKFVYCDDTRYNDLNDGEPSVNEINIFENK